MWKIVKPNCAVCSNVGTEFGVCVMVYTINRVLVCMRSEWPLDFGFTKWNRCLVIDVNRNPRVSLFM